MGPFDSWLVQRITILKRLSQDFDREFSLLASLLWSIWRGRNNSVFKAIRPDPEFTIQQATRLLSTMDLAKPVKEDRIIESIQSQRTRASDWIPPEGNSLKINVDASWVENLPQAALGVLIRDKYSTLLSGTHAKIYCSSPLTAEACAIREGLNLAYNLGCTEVVLESDNKSLVEACKANALIGEASTILQDIFCLKRHFHGCNFVWTNRERNKSAHLVAKACMQGLLSWNWLFMPPQELRRALVDDAQVATSRNGFPIWRSC